MSARAESRLRHAIELATSWEGAEIVHRKPIQVVAFGSAVRGRRLAEAVAALGPHYAYESRLQVRSLIEIYFNYAWIRIQNRHSRATRFMRYQVLERLRLAESLAGDSPAHATDLGPDIRKLRKERTRLRYLFRFTDRKGKRRWARNWAGELSFESRVRETLNASRAAGHSTDDFMYTLYRWLSGPTHGSVGSFDDVLVHAGERLQAKPTEELESHNEPNAVSAILLGIWTLAAVDMDFPKEVQRQTKHEFDTLRDDLIEEPSGV